MNSTKLTLSADKNLVSTAKRIAEAQGTSVSAMFMRFIRAIKTPQKPEVPLGHITQQASGMVRVSPKTSDRKLIEEALQEKYR